MKLQLIIIGVFSLFLGGVEAAPIGGFFLGKARVIYNESDKAENISVYNKEENTSFLVQSWVSGINGNVAPFFVSPPLYRQDYGRGTIRIVKTGSLPSNQESAFWLNVKVIPAVSDEKEKRNSVMLQFSYTFKLKMLYRPRTLSAEQRVAPKFIRDGNKVIIKNSSPYFVTFKDIFADGNKINFDGGMIHPFGEVSLQFPKENSSGNVILKYALINDDGSVNEKRITVS